MASERISDERFREWQEALAPYKNAVEEFARQKELQVDQWWHDGPYWMIGKTQKPDDLDKIQWNIQFNYDEEKKELGLAAIAWMDTKYDVSDGQVNQRIATDPEKTFKSYWKRGDPLNIEELLETAYKRATSYTKQDLIKVSASITGKDGTTRVYDPQSRSQG